jgi:hypothetical protein
VSTSDADHISTENVAESSPMDAETLEALRGSIAKWEGIVNGSEVDKGCGNCPLCSKFVNATGDCDGCPVYELSGQQACSGTPYERWHRVNPWPNKHPEWRAAKTKQHLAAAQAELEFLKSLLPAGVEP